MLQKELQRRLQAAGIAVEWAQLLRDLGRLRETELELQVKRYVLRSKAYGLVGRVLQCKGARLPATIRQLEDPLGECSPASTRAA